MCSILSAIKKMNLQVQNLTATSASNTFRAFLLTTYVKNADL